MKNIIARLLDNGLLTLKSAENVLNRMEKVNEEFVATDNEDLWFEMEEILNTFLDSLKLDDDELDEITLGLLGNPTAREMLGIMQTIIEDVEGDFMSETQFLKEGLPTGKSKNAQSSAKTLNNICNIIQRPDLQNKALVHASEIINLIDEDEG